VSESPFDSKNTEAIYERRFGLADSAHKDEVWAEICRYLNRFIPADAKILDLGCADGHFIRHIKAAELWASDLRDVSQRLPKNVHFVQASGLELDTVLSREQFDVIFMSNYLEHLLSRTEVVRQLAVCQKLLRAGGLVIVLQPNIRLVGGRYWDFVDHHVALTERSLAEAATLAGFTTERLITRFIPYSTLSRLPQHRLLVRAYLKVPLAWRILGKQTLYVGRARA
jgi:2-polyprenyl-3-methyl-5-hydroxy-6-metoxy-1,4-benzoquinol methylase